jgi:DNA-binding LacI/PurR family transcriptional regulator
VLQAANDLCYIPNLAAQSLRAKRNNVIAIYVNSAASLAEPGIEKFLTGLTEAASNQHSNRVMLLTRKNHVPSTTPSVILPGEPVDGVVLRDPGENDELLTQFLTGSRPFVVLGRPATPEFHFYVDNDNIGVARIAIMHLAGYGHQSIAFVNGPQELTVSVDRLRGYMQTLSMLGIPVDETLIRYADFTQDGGYAATRSLLTSGRHFTALWAANDAMAVGAMKAIRDAGLQVPSDISVMGVNIDLVAQACEPVLTTIDIHSYELGFATAIMLENLITGKEGLPNPTIIQGTLVVRKSTGPI